MHREHPDDASMSPPSAGAAGKGVDAGSESGDPNDALLKWEHELRDDPEHGLGREGVPDGSGGGVSREHGGR